MSSWPCLTGLLSHTDLPHDAEHTAATDIQQTADAASESDLSRRRAALHPPRQRPRGAATLPAAPSGLESLRVVGLRGVAARIDAGHRAVHHQVPPQPRERLAATVAAQGGVLLQLGVQRLRARVALLLSLRRNGEEARGAGALVYCVGEGIERASAAVPGRVQVGDLLRRGPRRVPDRRSFARQTCELEHRPLKDIERSLHLLTAEVGREGEREDLHRRDELTVHPRN
mmetsp:Transcript_12928/g.29757  ORF Transcript_12928/g.29757 Transcript_12928/m.29757 type:complete len:229 (-) Transcript_12928:298-984(-)